MKHIIFDIGNVLFTFRPEKFLHEIFTDENVIHACMSVYFSGLWNDYDLGTYTKEEMIQKGNEVYPQYAEEFRYMMDHWFEYLHPIFPIINELEPLQKKGYDLYILSNLPEDCHFYLCTHYDFFHTMQGVYSYQEHLAKPDVEIYQCLFQRYHLHPKDCLFIDDRKENVVVASELGCHIFWCQSIDQLKNELERITDESRK